MANTETRWPKQPNGDGVYWWRADANDSDPDVHFVQGEHFYQVGFSSSEVVANFGGEWLGPISPSDAEQLSELRQAAQAMVAAIHKAVYTVDICALAPNIHVAMTRLVAALNPSHSQKETL